jgi:SAM-dependent methyltransferase
MDLAPYYRDYPIHRLKLDFWLRLLKGNLLSHLRQAGLTPSAKFLDFGCGAGLCLRLLAEKGFTNLTGYDLYSPEYNHPEVLNQRYDFILAEDVLEHVDDPQALLKHWHALLNPGGRIFITTVNAAGIDLNKPDNYLHSLHQPFHPHLFSPQALEDMARRESFQVVRFYKRFYYDTLIPTVNYAFMLQYLKAQGNTFAVGPEVVDPKLFITNPALWFYAFFGYFFPNTGLMMMLLEKE